MRQPHLSANDLRGKVIDCHSHIGVALKAYACQEYPYAQALEGLYYRQLANRVDVNIVFPFSPHLFFDLAELTRERLVPAAQPLSPAPYAAENAMVMAEVFRFCPEISTRFLPFVSIDPEREVDAQLEALLELDREYPIYGIKIVPVACQSKASALLDTGRRFLDFARARDLPLLFHTTADKREGYSHARDLFPIIEQNPDLRFCLAHCIGFNRQWVERAAALANVWIDSSALKIQVQLASEGSPVMAPLEERVPGDYSDHTSIMRTFVERYPETMLWGTDSPAYSYICHRQQAEGVIEEFRLKATYEDERAALDALPEALQRQVSNENTLRFLFGAGC